MYDTCVHTLEVLPDASETDTREFQGENTRVYTREKLRLFRAGTRAPVCNIRVPC